MMSKHPIMTSFSVVKVRIMPKPQRPRHREKLVILRRGPLSGSSPWGR